MKILIVSDSHGHNELLDDLIRKYKDVDLFLHAGDSEVPPHTLFPFRVVKGNCDYYFELEKEYIIPSPFGNILLRHKEDAHEKYLQDNDIKFYIHGHTHVKSAYSKRGICYIDPGAICYPRDTCASYAILDSEEQESLVTFYRLEDHKELKQYRVYMGVPKKEETKKETSLKETLINTAETAVREAVMEEIKKIDKGE